MDQSALQQEKPAARRADTKAHADTPLSGDFAAKRVTAQLAMSHGLNAAAPVVSLQSLSGTLGNAAHAVAQRVAVVQLGTGQSKPQGAPAPRRAQGPPPVVHQQPPAQQPAPLVQQPVVPQVQALALLYPKADIAEDEDGANQKRAFNFFLNKLLEVGKQVGRTVAPLSQQEEQDAVTYITGKMGGGGGDYGVSCKDIAPQVVHDANAAGYDISSDAVRDMLQTVATERAGILNGGTQMGNHKGDWRGGGF